MFCLPFKVSCCEKIWNEIKGGIIYFWLTWSIWQKEFKSIRVCSWCIFNCFVTWWRCSNIELTSLFVAKWWSIIVISSSNLIKRVNINSILILNFKTYKLEARYISKVLSGFSTSIWKQLTFIIYKILSLTSWRCTEIVKI